MASRSPKCDQATSDAGRGADHLGGYADDLRNRLSKEACKVVTRFFSLPGLTATVLYQRWSIYLAAGSAGPEHQVVVLGSRTSLLRTEKQLRR